MSGSERLDQQPGVAAAGAVTTLPMNPIGIDYDLPFSADGSPPPPQRFNLLLLGGFAVLALILAAVGVYGIVAYTVSGRTREIGIRMALGAAGREVGRAVMGPALGPSVAGIAIGSAGAVLLGRALAPDLYEVRPHDRLTLAFVTLILLGAAAVACAIPARRASRIDPVIALRSE
jgi:putative ABC transport system permease protein